jgi:hypothetical protein
LGHYKWKYSPSDCLEVDKRTHASYENKLSDWMAIEAIVRQKDKEITAASIAKLSGKWPIFVFFFEGGNNVPMNTSAT